jgi:hypothetical protein
MPRQKNVVMIEFSFSSNLGQEIVFLPEMKHTFQFFFQKKNETKGKLWR